MHRLALPLSALLVACGSNGDGSSSPATAGSAGQPSAGGTAGANGQAGSGGTGTGGTLAGTGGSMLASDAAASHDDKTGVDASASDSSTAHDVDHPVDPCLLDGGCPAGTWINVTPRGVDLTDPLTCGNFGTETVQVDPMHPEQIYTLFSCQGIWKSNDYGQTWNGPINTGTNGAMIGDCAGGITIPPYDTSSLPTLYASCIRGAGTGFSRSTNGGVDWTHYNVNVAGSNGQFYPPVVDPHDAKHLLIAGHGIDFLAESTDGGQTWSEVAMDPAMKKGGTGAINFIDTGVAATTRNTWLWLGQASGGVVGTWRTTTGAAAGAWTRVETNEHPPGIAQIYQPDTSGVVFMAGLYSKQGFGVFRSGDYGVTWTHVGASLQERVAFGTKKRVYAMMGNEVSGTGSDPALQTDQGTGTWATVAIPGMTQGLLQALRTSDGKNDIILLASWTAGLYRYVEPN